MVGPLALGIEHLNGEPGDRQRVGAVAQRHLGEPAVHRGGALAAFEHRLAMLLERGAIQVFADGPVRGGFASEDEMAPGGLNIRRNRLAGEQIVAEKHRAQMSQRGAMPGEPALGRVALAVLLLRAGLRHDELWRQRQDMLVPRRHNAGAEEGMEIFSAAVGAPARRAPRAMDLA